MSQNGKLMPNLDQQSTKILNLTVLQRIDPFVEEILITAAHVTFYEFNIDLSQWVSLLTIFFLTLLIIFSLLIDCHSFTESEGRGGIFICCQEVILFLHVFI